MQAPATPPPAATARAPRNSLGLLACLLLALVQVLWAGYQLGVGNQSIQVAFLWKRMDPALFPRDAMVNTTLARYPSLFFHALAPLARVIELEHLYLALHLATAIGVLVAVAALVRAMFGSRGAGFVALLFLLAGHHTSLAEQSLYSSGLTHTWAVFPVMIAALALLYAERHWAAFAITGALVNFHALEAGQLGFCLGVWALGNWPRLGWRKLAGLLVVMAACAAPAAWLALRAHETFDAQWMQLMHIRSALHSFPSAWWRAGNPEIPRFALIFALAALAWTPRPERSPTTRWLVVGVAVLFVAGYLFTEVWPHPVAVRAQLFRSSRFLLVLLLAYIAWGCRQGWVAGRLEFGVATLTALAIAVPPASVLLPVAVLVTALVALLRNRLAWWQALLAGAASVVSVVAWRQIQFVVPGLSPEFSWPALLAWRGPGLAATLVIAAAGVLWWLADRELSPWRAAGLTTVGALTALAILVPARERLLTPPAADAAWFDAQRWVRDHTPVDALLLTPPQMGGFRMLSQRSLAGEWRDGTQLYFSGAFTKPWWNQMNLLQPGLRLKPDGRQLLVRGKPLGDLDDEKVLALARAVNATHIVLPADETRRLRVLYTNAVWGVYWPDFAPVEQQQGALLAKQEKFLRDVAVPNIAQHRQSDVRLQIVGADGRPVYDAQYKVVQTNSAFGFGATLPAGEPARGRFRDWLNYTVISEPAWWANIEPRDGHRQYDVLEEQLAWCRQQGVATEFSFLTGMPPAWVREAGSETQNVAVSWHALDLLNRFADQVTWWQLCDQGVLLAAITNAWPLIQPQHTPRQFGLSDAGRFHSYRPPAEQEADLCRGLADAKRLREQGIPVSYVALHGHQPWGLWADAATMYAVFDAYAKEGLRVHITEFSVPAEGWIEGPVRGDEWNPKLQAAYLRTFYTVAYSHPAVETIHYADAGLFGADGKLRGVGGALRDTLKQWRSRVTGKVPLDGRVAFRGFHGDYELVVTLKNGQTARAGFRVGPCTVNEYRFQLDAATGNLVVAP